MKKCVRCRLAAFRKKQVIGRGDLPCDVLMLGEAPGRSEDAIGEAFIGQSGKLLDCMIDDAKKISKINSLRIYFTNVVQCRPCDDKNAPNREPNFDEILACSDNFFNTLDQTCYKLIIFVGKVSEKYYKKEFPMSFSINHPSFILRLGGRNTSQYRYNVLRLVEAFKNIT